MTVAPLLIRCASLTSAELAAQLDEAARLTHDGQLVAFPTETVYGIAARADDPAALERLQHVKRERSAKKHWTVHIADRAQLSAIAREIPPPASQLMEAFWPGPLTIILPGRDQATVGVRLPDHEIARAFLRLCDVPVVAPSANRSGELPATDAETIAVTFGTELAAIIDGGTTRYRQASTVVDATTSPVHLLREGVIAREQLRTARIPLV